MKSCSIKNFSIAFAAGYNSILSIELSYISDCFMTGILSMNPKILKVAGTIIENIEDKGIELCLAELPASKKENGPS